MSILHLLLFCCVCVRVQMHLSHPCCPVRIFPSQIAAPVGKSAAGHTYATQAEVGCTAGRGAGCDWLLLVFTLRDHPNVIFMKQMLCELDTFACQANGSCGQCPRFSCLTRCRSRQRRPPIPSRLLRCLQRERRACQCRRQSRRLPQFADTGHELLQQLGAFSV